jgi:hypothetical protein
MPVVLTQAADRDPEQPLLARARRPRPGAPPAERTGDVEHPIAVHHAHQIVSFYEHYALRAHCQRVTAADRLARRHRLAVPDSRIASAPLVRRPVPVDRRDVRSRGTVSLEPDAVAEMPPREPGVVRAAARRRPPRPVRARPAPADPTPFRAWLAAPIKTRGPADSGSGSHMTGGSLRRLVRHPRTPPTTLPGRSNPIDPNPGESTPSAGPAESAARVVNETSPQRSGLKNSRMSAINRSGASSARKCPPRPNSDQWTMLLLCSA